MKETILIKNILTSLLFIIGLNFCHAQQGDQIGKGKHCKDIFIFSGITEYGEQKQKKKQRVCDKSEAKLTDRVKEEATNSYYTELKETSVFRERALSWEGFYTDPVTGKKCVNANVVDKIQSSSGFADSQTKTAVSKRSRSCGDTKADASRKKSEDEEASSKWISDNKYQVAYKDKDKIFNSEDFIKKRGKDKKAQEDEDKRKDLEKKEKEKKEKEKREREKRNAGRK